MTRISMIAPAMFVFLLPLLSAAGPTCSQLYAPDGRLWIGTLGQANPRFAPQWSADGAHIVFTYRERGDDGSTYLARSDGSSVRRISEGEGEYDVDYSPDISPDGSSIVYATSRHLTEGDYYTWGGVTRNFEIETSGLNGSDRRRLTENGDLDTSPLWSPDGMRLAFTLTEVEYPPGPGAQSVRRTVLYTVGADGTELTRLVASQDEYVDSIVGTSAWSPDGQELAFLRADLPAELSEGRAAVKLYAIAPDGSGLREVSDPGWEFFLGREVASSLSWSPDGKSILFSLAERRNRLRGTTYLVNAEQTGNSGRYTITTSTPTRSLHELTGWAVEQGIELQELSVSRPSLEDLFIELANPQAKDGEEA